LTVVAIHQPNFVPWLGYFHKMLLADVFVLLDHVQFERGVNRNRIKTPNGELSLTVPIRSGDRRKPIMAVQLADEPDWQKEHMESLRRSYSRSPHFLEYAGTLEAIYQQDWTHLADLNKRLIFQVKEWLGITTPVCCSSELDGLEGKKNELILSICRRLGATVYLSGRGAAAYNDPARYDESGIRLVYQEFQHPIYPQPWGEFRPNLSALDCLFNCGGAAGDLLRIR
jgi:hypothetical protein